MITILRKGRTVYTNMDGLDTDHCRKALSYVVGRDIEDQLIFLDKDAVKHFWDVCGHGSVIIIDEVHKLWSSRTYASDSNKQFAEWCSTHRHGGYDVILMTQALDKLDGHVRSLIEWTHRFRKVNFVGSLVKKSYLEYVYSEDDERNCLSRKRHSYDGRIFPCYKSYVAKDIREKRIGKPTNVFRHPVFYALPVLLVVMIVMVSKSSFIHGDIFGSKKHIKTQTAVVQKAASPGAAPVSLNKDSKGGFFQDGKWVAGDGKASGAVLADKGPVVESKPGKDGYVYHEPAKVVREGLTWKFIEQGTGRVIGFVKWSDESDASLPRGSMSTAGGGGEPDVSPSSSSKSVAVTSEDQGAGDRGGDEGQEGVRLVRKR
jgi:hypothetical protein